METHPRRPRRIPHPTQKSLSAFLCRLCVLCELCVSSQTVQHSASLSPSPTPLQQFTTKNFSTIYRSQITTYKFTTPNYQSLPRICHCNPAPFATSQRHTPKNPRHFQSTNRPLQNLRPFASFAPKNFLRAQIANKDRRSPIPDPRSAALPAPKSKTPHSRPPLHPLRGNQRNHHRLLQRTPLQQRSRQKNPSPPHPKNHPRQPLQTLHQL